MIGATIQANKKSSLWESAITLDSQLGDDNDVDGGSINQVNYEELIALKITMAELQTELQIQGSRTSKYQSLLAQAQQEKQSLEIENKALKENAKNEVTLDKLEVRRLKNENRHLRLMIRELSPKSNKIEVSHFNDASKSSSDSCISHVSIEGHETPKSPEAVLRRSLLSKFKESFRSERYIETSSITQNIQDASQITSRNEDWSRLCKSISTSLTSSFTAMSTEADMDSSIDDSNHSYMTDLGSEKS